MGLDIHANARYNFNYDFLYTNLSRTAPDNTASSPGSSVREAAGQD